MTTKFNNINEAMDWIDTTFFRAARIIEGDWHALYESLPPHDILTINSLSSFGQQGILAINSLSRIDPRLKRLR